MAQVSAWPKKSLIFLVKVYQLCISPLIGPRCRFYPNCSQYGVEALHKHGAIKGCFLIIRRLAKCHPFHPGGIDWVP